MDAGDCYVKSAKNHAGAWRVPNVFDMVSKGQLPISKPIVMLLCLGYLYVRGASELLFLFGVKCVRVCAYQTRL